MGKLEGMCCAAGQRAAAKESWSCSTRCAVKTENMGSEMSPEITQLCHRLQQNRNVLVGGGLLLSTPRPARCISAQLQRCSECSCSPSQKTPLPFLEKCHRFGTGKRRGRMRWSWYVDAFIGTNRSCLLESHPMKRHRNHLRGHTAPPKTGHTAVPCAPDPLPSLQRLEGVRSVRKPAFGCRLAREGAAAGHGPRLVLGGQRAVAAQGPASSSSKAPGPAGAGLQTAPAKGREGCPAPSDT